MATTSTTARAPRLTVLLLLLTATCGSYGEGTESETRGQGIAGGGVKGGRSVNQSESSTLPLVFSEDDDDPATETPLETDTVEDATMEETTEYAEAAGGTDHTVEADKEITSQLESEKELLPQLNAMTIEGTHPTIPSVNWYVSLSGYRSGSCGQSLDVPCRNLAFVIAIANDYDTIYIDGRPPPPYITDHIYSLCYKNQLNLHGHIQKKSLNLVGHFGRPTLGCTSAYDDIPKTSNGEHSLYVSSPTSNKDCLLSLTNLYIEDGIIPLGNCTVNIDNVKLVNASIKTSTPCHFLNLTITHSNFSDGQVCDQNGACKHDKLNKVYCLDSFVTVLHSSFYQTSLVVDSGAHTVITVSNSRFSNLEQKIRFLGGLHLTFSAYSAEIHIRNSTFENQVHPTRVQSVINLYDGAIWLKVSEHRQTEFPVTNANAIVEHCIFRNNERGITMVGPFLKLLIHQCIFKDNVAMHAGAGMLVLIHKNTGMAITNCTFVNNVAGKYRDDYPIADKVKSFEVVNSEVHLNAECCKGVVSLVGKGGGIRVQRGFVEINDTVFINNTARLLGGSVFVDMDGNLTAFRTKFENTPIHDHALQGDVLYSDGTIKIDDVKMIVKSANNGLSIFRHAGDHWSLEITNVWIQCPVGYDLRATNSSAYGVTTFGLKRSHKLDQLSYFCESCPRNKYSLDNGYLNYTMVFNSFSYFTLLINGSSPEPQYTGKYVHHIIKCSDCPYGGHCVQGISAVANFWGYIQDGAVKFQHCPKGYCCAQHDCPTINACADRRGGRLCGRCEEGYAEALFSPICVPNDRCGPTWLLPFGLLVGLVYAIFLLFQADLQHFLFGTPLGLCCTSKRFKRTYQATYMNGNATTPPDPNSLPKSNSPISGFVKTASPDCEENNDNQFGENHTVAGVSSVTEPLKPKPETPKKKSDCRMVGFGSGFLVIMFYYFQDALLLNVKTVYISKESKGQKLLKSILSGIFKFQLDLFELIEEVCAMSQMHAVHKTVTKAFIVPYVIILFGTMYISYKWVLLVKRGIGSRPASARQEQRDENSNRKSFATRLSSGFILALLFMFQKMGTTTFILLNCVPVEGDKVLFIDGTVTCYEFWQYGVMSYAVGSVTPFFLIICIGPMMLQRAQISLTEFFIGCLLPLPVLLLWVIRGILWTKGRRPPPHTLPPNVKAVLQVVQGPFIENKYGVCWSGVLVGRRLVLILLFTFVTDTLIRLLGMLLACFIILLHHVHVKPYKDPRGNVAGTLSAAALVILGSINLVRAGFEAAEYTPTGPNAFLMKIFTEIENALLIWVPLAVMSFVFFIFIIRIISSLGRCIVEKEPIPITTADNPVEEERNQS